MGTECAAAQSAWVTTDQHFTAGISHSRDDWVNTKKEQQCSGNLHQTPLAALQIFNKPKHETYCKCSTLINSHEKRNFRHLNATLWRCYYSRMSSCLLRLIAEALWSVDLLISRQQWRRLTTAKGLSSSIVMKHWVCTLFKKIISDRQLIPFPMKKRVWHKSFISAYSILWKERNLRSSYTTIINSFSYPL